MGWSSEDRMHDGSPVAIVELDGSELRRGDDDGDRGPEPLALAIARANFDRVVQTGLYRELRYPYDRRAPSPIVFVQAGCDCGWRSPRVAPLDVVTWAPFSPIVSERDEERLRLLWRRHVAAECE